MGAPSRYRQRAGVLLTLVHATMLRSMQEETPVTATQETAVEINHPRRRSMKRRHFLLTASAGLASPSVVRASSASTLKFIPQIDLAFLDPHWTTANVTRGHAYMVFDTLYGQDGTYTPSPRCSTATLSKMTASCGS